MAAQAILDFTSQQFLGLFLKNMQKFQHFEVFDEYVSF
jgi:hypothetical protein